MKMELRCWIVSLFALALLAIGGCATTTPIVNAHARLQAYRAYKDGNVEEARGVFQKCVDRDPTELKSNYYLGRILLDHYEQPADAAKHFETAYAVLHNRAEQQIRDNPNLDNTGVPTPTLSQVADGLAEAMFRQKLRTQLVGFLSEVVDYRGSIEDYQRKGRYLYKLGDHDGARDAYITATRIAGKTTVEPYVELAEFYDNIGARDEALVALRKAYGIDSTYPDLAKRIRDHGMVPGPTVALPIE